MNTVIGIVLPVFGTLGLGYAAARFKVFDEAANRGLSLFVFNFAIPLMLFRAIAQTDLPSSMPWGYLLSYFIGAFAVFGAAMILTRTVFGKTLEAQAVTGLSASYSNTAMLGIPLVITAFGSPAALPLFVLIASHSLLMLPPTTLLVEAARGGEQASLWRMFGRILRGLALMPIMWGLSVGLTFAVAGWSIPGALDSVAEGMAAAAAPCALFALGASLMRYRIAGNLVQPLTIVALKTLVHPLLVWLLATQVFNVPQTWAVVAVVLAALPSGVTPYLFAQRYRVGAAEVASTVFISTIFSVFSLTVLLYLLQS